MNKSTLKTDIIPVLFLTIVVCVSVIALSLTNGFTEGKIADAKENEVKLSLQGLFTEMDDFEYDDNLEVYTILSENSVVGYAFNVVGKGYGGDIEIIVGIEKTTLEEDDVVLRGISIVSHSETPGLGEKIVKDAFYDQFKGVNINDVSLSKDGGSIDAISGATISSLAVTTAVHDRVIEKIELIRKNLLMEV
ncbi:MAG: FMN-binding protein [Candidatus Thermoplasmatota archaeon]|nr:FMN-binding protein [Candidatus Thermoplasmatota archaeon]